MKSIEVVAAVMEFDGNILCVQRGDGKYDYVSRKWEFPGGKVEIGESLEEAIRREIREELEANLVECFDYITVQHQYPDFFLTMHCFLCPVPDKHVVLTEHIAHMWLPRRELDSLDWAAADLPIVDKLMSHDD
ncbi:(deoxy)nucleoside triphosphate pyrophosphohydrolase [Marinobacter alexandrii]|uniref:(deoxy)nucleoside triphosphate pyrophosphohydrolase n=1 Tax=Marinobacter alexandrii TaxID=2570351 RepID=UPI003297EF7A